MSVTIQMKRGDGAPSGGTLVSGEPGWDTTNFIIYCGDGTDIYYAGQYIPGTNGIDFIYGSDADVDLISLPNITGTPNVKWDESEDAFAFNQGLIAGDGGSTNYAKFTTDGELSLHGTARVYKNEWIPVNSLRVPTSNPATAVDWGISMGYEFTDGASDTIYGTINIPQDMDRTVAPEFKIGWASATADPGDDSKQVVWQLEYLYVAAGESTIAAAQETLTATTSASTTANGLTISTFTGVDLPGSTDQLMMIRIKRLGADGDDDLGDDCTLLGCGFKYASDKLGVAL